ncbi:MAG: PKD domain-containing protein [Halobacteriales archaeon]
MTVEPDNRPPTAAFDWDPSNPDPGEQTFFDASASTETYGEIESYEWDFGGGRTGKGKKPTHRFPNGEYSVSLTVTDDEGATDTTTQEIAITFG